MAICKDCINVDRCFCDPQRNSIKIKGVEKICEDFKPIKASTHSKNPNNSNKCEKESVPNFEEEYYRLISEVKFLRKENLELKETILEMCKKMFRESENNGKM